MLTCLHQNNLGMDEFLGQVTLPLNEIDVYDNPKSKWYKLQSKPGQEKKSKERGELELRIGFTVKAESVSDLKKDKHKSSLGQIASNVSGSLLSINTLEKRKNLKKFAKSLGSKMHITGKSKKEKNLEAGEADSVSGSVTNVWSTPTLNKDRRSAQMAGDADPGVISEDEDEFTFDNLSHKSSGSSLNVQNRGYNQNKVLNKNSSPIVSLKSDHSSIQDIHHDIDLNSDMDMSYRNKSATLPTPQKPPRVSSSTDSKKDEWEEKLYGKHMELGSSNDSLKRRSWDPTARVPLAVPKEEEEEPENRKNPTINYSNTAPSSPAVSEKKTPTHKPPLPITPQPMPRSNTLESITEKVKDEKVKEKEKKADKENKFTKKLKYLRKEFGRSDNHHQNQDDLPLPLPPSRSLSSQFFQHGERIIIGHENDVKMMTNGELSKEVQKKYEGKSKEVRKWKTIFFV